MIKKSIKINIVDRGRELGTEWVWDEVRGVLNINIARGIFGIGGIEVKGKGEIEFIGFREEKKNREELFKAIVKHELKEFYYVNRYKISSEEAHNRVLMSDAGICR